jgi:DNA topoisomerase II
MNIEKKYKKINQIEHVLLKPGMYIGDIEFRNNKEFIFINNKIKLKYIDFSPGLYKIIDELIVNVYDQTLRDKTLNNIECIITKDYFEIYNDGLGIDIIKHKEYKIYIPELIFGHLMTSTNFDVNEQRITGGTHGLGAKLTAIYSKKFIIEVWDKKRELYYYQELNNNLSEIKKPEIKENKKKLGGVKIRIYPDFEKFKIKNFSDDMINLYKKRFIDLSSLINQNIKLKLNNEIINNSLQDYLNLYNSNWIIGDCKKNDYWEYGISLNNDEDNIIITFVNGIYTKKGGKHLDYFIDLLLNKFKKLISNDLTKKFLFENLNIFLKTAIINPSFNSQIKEELETPIDKFGYECIITDNFWNKLKESNIINELKLRYEQLNINKFKKQENKTKIKSLNILKLEDANYAGTKKSNECTLIITEGDSAKSTAISGISAIENGRNYYGVYPLRGKLLNVREASINQINNNKEILELKKILGLKTGITYTKDNINELRYGSLLIMTDADEDGSHIKGLILNFIDYYYPSLLKIEGYIKILMTPLIKAISNKEIINFSNIRSYKKWKETNDLNKWKIKYYKGLGTSTSQEAQEYFKNINNNIIYILNENDKNELDLPFSKDKIEDRKEWLKKYDINKTLNIEPPTKITVDKFIHNELIHFSNYDNLRSIPNIMDGLKPSQRKVLYTCLKKNINYEIKVAQLAAIVAELTYYHHGEQSLVGTIINMAQDYIGSNNLNLLTPQGQFGSRLMGGKDHSSARYIFTYITEYVNTIYNKIDDDLLEYLEDDGNIIEPKHYIPIIPMILINGTEGIGTGFSTYIPCHNPLDIISYIMNKLTNKKEIELIPYYKNSKGKIIKYDDTTWISEGILEINEDKNEIIILELPIRLWTNDYKEYLEEMITNNIIKSYKNLSSDKEIKIIINYSNNKEYIENLKNSYDENKLNNLYKLLKLYKTIKISNMTLYNNNYEIKLYKTTKEIIDDYYKIRLEYYNKRKELIIKKINEEINNKKQIIKFIKLVIENNILNNSMENIINILKKNKFEIYDNLLNMSFKQLTKENKDKLEEKIKELEKELIYYQKINNKELWINDLNNLSRMLINNCSFST